jgi:hypothetical protein
MMIAMTLLTQQDIAFLLLGTVLLIIATTTTMTRTFGDPIREDDMDEGGAEGNLLVVAVVKKEAESLIWGTSLLVDVVVWLRQFGTRKAI